MNILVSEILNNFFSAKNIMILPELMSVNQFILNISSKHFFFCFLARIHEIGEH